MTDQLNWHNKLYFGDNLSIMRDYLADESVDLIYLDPPFNSKATYNLLFHEKDGKESPSQITAFEDTWHWDQAAEATYWELVKEGPKRVADVMQALRQFLGSNDVLAYLVMMAIRLIEMRRILKETGSLYLHCDPTASHYIKLVLDAVFGPKNFRNEIVWQRTAAKGDAKRKLGSVHDVIFAYSRSDNYYFKPVRRAMDEDYLARFKCNDDDGRGSYRLAPLDSPSPRPNLTYEYKGYQPPAKGWRVSRELMEELDKEGRLAFPRSKDGRISRKHYLDEQEPPKLTDVWTDIKPLQAVSFERLGYPTQKPEQLLERMIEASSNEGDIVLDPFAGCGTATAVSERLRRRWIAIDVTHLAVTLMVRRLIDTFGEELRDFEIIGDPKDVGGAEELAHQNRHQFEWWALSLAGARPAQDKKKGADRGIDGYIYFQDDESGQAKTIVVQVKSGHVGSSIIRDLKGTVDREKAAIGVLVTLQKPTGPMKKESLEAGYYEPEHFPGKKYPKLQILTVEDLLQEKVIEYPRMGPESTFKKAKRQQKKQGEQGSLLEE